MIARFEGSVSRARTMPSHLRGVPVTHVRAGEDAIGLYWRDGALLGLGEVDPDAAYSTALARADDGYVAYDLRAEHVVRVAFDGRGLTLRRSGSSVRAERDLER
jgi:hypothetical protein